LSQAIKKIAVIAAQAEIAAIAAQATLITQKRNTGEKKPTKAGFLLPATH
jgi:hypothetical protein